MCERQFLYNLPMLSFIYVFYLSVQKTMLAVFVLLFLTQAPLNVQFENK